MPALARGTAHGAMRQKCLKFDCLPNTLPAESVARLSHCSHRRVAYEDGRPRTSPLGHRERATIIFNSCNSVHKIKNGMRGSFAPRRTVLLAANIPRILEAFSLLSFPLSTASAVRDQTLHHCDVSTSIKSAPPVYSPSVEFLPTETELACRYGFWPHLERPLEPGRRGVPLRWCGYEASVAVCHLAQ